MSKTEKAEKKEKRNILRGKMSLITYSAYGLFVIVPLILGLLPASWGKIADVADAILSYQPLGYVSSFVMLVSPFLFWRMWRQTKRKRDLIATIISFILLLFIVVSIFMLIRSIQEL